MLTLVIHYLSCSLGTQTTPLFTKFRTVVLCATNLSVFARYSAISISPAMNRLCFSTLRRIVHITPILFLRFLKTFRWQSFCSSLFNNKIHTLKLSVSWSISFHQNRLRETALAHLFNGHTHITPIACHILIHPHVPYALFLFQSHTFYFPVNSLLQLVPLFNVSHPYVFPHFSLRHIYTHLLISALTIYSPTLPSPLFTTFSTILNFCTDDNM